MIARWLEDDPNLPSKPLPDKVDQLHNDITDGFLELDKDRKRFKAFRSEVRGEFRKVHERLTTQEARLDGLQVEVREGFERVDDRFGQIDDRFGQIDQRFGQIDEQLGQLEENQHATEYRLGRLEDGQARLVATVAAQGDRLDGMDQRLGRLEDGQTTLVATVERLAGAVERIEERLN